MTLNLDVTDLKRLDSQLALAGRALDKNTLRSAMRKALNPTLSAVKSQAPRGKGYERVSLSARTKSNDYRRGGATQKDARILIVDGQGNEEVRGLVGISKRRGNVGWRTHFITRGTKDRRTKKGAYRGRMPKNDFLARAYGQTIDIAVNSFSRETQNAVNRVLDKLR